MTPYQNSTKQRTQENRWQSNAWNGPRNHTFNVNSRIGSKNKNLHTHTLTHRRATDIAGSQLELLGRCFYACRPLVCIECQPHGGGGTERKLGPYKVYEIASCEIQMNIVSYAKREPTRITMLLDPWHMLCINGALFVEDEQKPRLGRRLSLNFTFV